MHEVILTECAQQELDLTHKWWAENRSPQQADNWYIGFVKKMLTLEQNPGRCPLAPENELFPYEVRQFSYGLGSKPTHRALYTIRSDVVVILRVRHFAQKLVSDEDV